MRGLVAHSHTELVLRLHVWSVLARTRVRECVRGSVWLEERAKCEARSHARGTHRLCSCRLTHSKSQKWPGASLSKWMKWR